MNHPINCQALISNNKIFFTKKCLACSLKNHSFDHLFNIASIHELNPTIKPRRKLNGS